MAVVVLLVVAVVIGRWSWIDWICCQIGRCVCPFDCLTSFGRWSRYCVIDYPGCFVKL